MTKTLFGRAVRGRARASLGWLCCLELASALLAPAHSSAQSRFSAEALTLSPLLGNSGFANWGTRTLEPGRFAAMLDVSYARRPLTLRESSSKNLLGDLVGSMSTFELTGTVGVVDRLDVSVGLPLHRVSAGSALGDTAPAGLRAATVSESSTGLGDIRVVPRFRLFGDAQRRSGLGVAALLPMWLPTGDDSLYVGEAFRVEPRLAFDYALSRVRLLANVGYLIRKETVVLGERIDDMVTFGLGATVEVVNSFSLLAEVAGRLNVLASSFGRDDAPMELLFGARYAAGPWTVQLGGAPGLVGGVSEPAWRLLGMVSFLSAEPKHDRDGDGVNDDEDGCPTQAEDRDDFQDADGCFDADNDQDGVPDSSDRCPNEPEDRDSFEDADGCPDPDNDKDGVPDATDACPNLAGQPSEDSTARGCPDRDGDGALDATDACPDVPGVKSARPEANGCPEVRDRDGDGIIDSDDACPDVAGVPNPQPGHNGCPAARIEQGKIVFEERIEFATSSANLLPASASPLAAVQRVLAEHPEVTKLSVEGHTDNSGGAVRNTKLSQARADSVRKWLIEHGIAAERLTANGYGPTRPIADNSAAEGRTRNRRVEFQILEGAVSAERK